VEDVPRVIHEAFLVARSGRPGPVFVDLPKDVMNARGRYLSAEAALKDSVFAAKLRATERRQRGGPMRKDVERAVEMMAQARRPIFYTGGGVINSGICFF
jgi:acetolactate synthase-1/2/3 large subunit